MRRHPALLQINASFFLSRMQAKYGQTLNIAAIPVSEWSAIAEKGFDWIWLMGVWHRSPFARDHALRDPNLKKAYSEFLGDWTPKDVGGSPYAVYGYTVDPYLGSKEDFIRLRKNLRTAGLNLMLDFVPNHLAIDHPWTVHHPEYFVQASKKSLKDHPDWFFQAPSGSWLAYGRDPYFPPWIDTAQVNFFSKKTRRVLIDELLNIAELCDGVRCDMAMLGLNKIFTRVWADWIDEKEPREEFWAQAIGEVREKYPSFVWMGEVYWDLEWDLQQLGFNFTYDKRLYDRLKSSRPEDIRGHLRADREYQQRSVRFIENHDEERSAACLGTPRAMAAAAVTATIQGLRFFQDGQLEGKRLRTPIHLRREAPEKNDPSLVDFYRMLLDYIKAPVFQSGAWKLVECGPSSEFNETYRNLLAWSWESENDRRLIVINYSEEPAQAWLPAEFFADQGKTSRLRDRRTGEIYKRDREELLARGLYVDLKPWQMHLFELVMTRKGA